MTTLTYTNRHNFIPHFLEQYNKFALLAMGCAALFVSYFLIPQSTIVGAVLQFDIFFVVFVPFIGLVFSVIALRQIAHTHDKGMIASYVTLGVMGFYFIIALAIPFILIGLYIIYTYLI